MNRVIVCVLIVVVVAIAIMTPSSQAMKTSDHAGDWYKYCENLARKISQAYGQGNEPTDLIEQYKVCDQIAECQSHSQPNFGIGDPCVPSGGPPGVESSGTSSRGIPGFPFESIFGGLLIGVAVLVMFRRK